MHILKHWRAGLRQAWWAGIFHLFIIAGQALAQIVPDSSSLSWPSESFYSHLDLGSLTRKIIDTAILSVLVYMLLFALVAMINRTIRNIKGRHLARKTTTYFLNFLLLAGIFLIWFQNLPSFTLFIGLMGAGIALALQEVILSMAGWFLIVTRRPFETGDRIEINGVKGDIIDIRLFSFSMLEIGNWVDADQSTGRIVQIPNSYVFKHAQYNYSRGFEFIWNEITVLVTFESDWKRAKEIISQIGQKYSEGLPDHMHKKIEVMKNQYMIYYEKLTPIVYVNIKNSGVELTLRYLTEAKKRRSSQDGICQELLDEFNKEPSVNFVYPTTRIIRTEA